MLAQLALVVAIGATAGVVPHVVAAWVAARLLIDEQQREARFFAASVDVSLWGCVLLGLVVDLHPMLHLAPVFLVRSDDHAAQDTVRGLPYVAFAAGIAALVPAVLSASGLAGWVIGAGLLALLALFTRTAGRPWQRLEVILATLALALTLWW